MTWSNAAVPSATDTEFHFPEGRVLSHSSKIDTINWQQHGPSREADIKEMTGYFRDNQLSRIEVTGNGQTIYYAVDQEVIVGVNKTVSSNLVIYLKDNQISRINYMTKPDGTYYPLEMFPSEEARLSDFKWVEEWRPVNYLDVFRWKSP